MTLSMMAIARSAGVLTGVISPNVLVGVIIVIYGANQISVVPLLPEMMGIGHETIFSILLSAVLSIALLLISIFIFERKQF